jgi:uncharacterized protein YqhQ
MSTTERLRVGGQAVIEGVMMRTESALTVSVRKADGTIKTKEEYITPLSVRYPLLKKPMLRGVVVLLESLVHGISALTFSANEAAEGEAEATSISPWAMGLTIVVSLGLGIVLFVVLPHFLTVFIGTGLSTPMGVNTLLFHLIDGFIKVVVFVLYIVGISFMPDIRRVFMYHGAEHKSIFTFEAGEELTVQNARKYKTLHPRCGTSFIITVLLISIFVFAAVFPFMPSLPNVPAFLRNLIYVFIKIPLLLPIAGISYEFIRLAGNHMDNPFLTVLSLPGIWLQKMTTREPTDDQLEVALAALSRSVQLYRERTQET